MQTGSQNWEREGRESGVATSRGAEELNLTTVVDNCHGTSRVQITTTLIGRVT